MQIVKIKDLNITITTEIEADIKTLIQLIPSQWKFEITSQASNDLNIKKWNKISIVPLVADLKLLKEFLINKANSVASVLDNNIKNETA